MIDLGSKPECAKTYTKGQAAVVGDQKTKLRLVVDGDFPLVCHTIDGCVFPAHDSPRKCAYLAETSAIEAYIELKTSLSAEPITKAIDQIESTIIALGRAGQSTRRRYFIVKGRSGLPQTEAQRALRLHKAVLNKHKAALRFPPSAQELAFTARGEIIGRGR